MTDRWPSFLLTTWALIGATLSAHAVAADEPPLATTEYKAVRVSDSEDAATAELNRLAEQGWTFKGPLGNGLVVFKRTRASGAVHSDLEGRWEYLSWEKDGVEKDYEPGRMTLTVIGDQWIVEPMIHVSAKRLTISGDTFVLHGRGHYAPKLARDTGVTVAYGVYKLEGDRLTLCMTSNTDASNARLGLIKTPTSFETEGTGNMVYVLRRIPPTTPKSRTDSDGSGYGMEPAGDHQR